MHSFDAPRARQVPTSFGGITPDGKPVSDTFAPRHLVIAVKESCDGCAELLEASYGTYDKLGIEILFLAHEVGVAGTAHRPRRSMAAILDAH
jgi:hypothetical protein